jgi:hypothetical protein
MAKHRRYSRKRGQRRNRRASRKMRGGVDSPNQSSVAGPGLNMSDLNVSGQSSVAGPGLNMSDLNVSGQSNISAQSDANNQQGLQGWVNPDYSGNTTFETYEGQQSNNSDFSLPSVSEEESIVTPDFGDISGISAESNDNNVVDDDDMNFSFDSLGGKRRSLAKQTKRKTNKRKSKKSKKTRKHRKRRQYGSGFTTSITTNPIAYKEDEYDQFKNALNYNS